MSDFNTDVAIIGGGMIGTSIARELSRYKLRVLQLEKEADLASGSSKAGNGIVHSGFYEAPESLKAKLEVAGNARYKQLCDELDLLFIQPGYLVVAKSDEEIDVLERMKGQGEKSGVPGLRIVDREELLRMEPNITRDAVAALYSPTAGVVSPARLTMALGENAVQNGVKLMLNTKVGDIKVYEDETFTLKTSRGNFRAQYVVNAAGLFADEVARMIGDDSFEVIVSKRQMSILDNKVGGLIRHLISPIPIPGKRRLVIPTVDGNLMTGVGDITETRNKMDLPSTRKGIDEAMAHAKEIVPAISERHVITSFAGPIAIKPGISDFLLEPSRKEPNFINAAIDGPGTAAIATIAEHVVDVLANVGLKLVRKDHFKPRVSIPRFEELPNGAKSKLIAEDRRYGHIVCRCEHVTEGEIIEAIRRGATTMDGIKFRTRAGMGRCHGGFCTPHVIRILARELGIPVQEVTKRGGDSRLLPYRSKEFLPEGKSD